jgi:hypothetical protein
MHINKEIKTIHVHIKRPSLSKPGGVSVVGHYWVEGIFVVMCTPDGVPIELNGKRFRRRFGTKSGELSEREVGGADDAGNQTRAKARTEAEPTPACNILWWANIVSAGLLRVPAFTAGSKGGRRLQGVHWWVLLPFSHQP